MKRLIILLFLLPFIMANTYETKRVKFYEGSLKSAQTQAARDGKLYFVDFVANYCHACKIMDETTYRDENVIRYIDANYIPIKVNIDDFDGFALKQQYEIKVLPTILVFNSKGKLVGRHEEGMGGSKMLTVLKNYDLPRNRVRSSRPSIPKPQLPINQTTSKEAKPVTTPNSSGASKQTPSSGEGLFEFSVKRHPSQGYGVQFGVFADYANVLKETTRLTEKYRQPILVNINELNGKVVYKIIVGNYSTRANADALKANMKKNNDGGFTVDLSTFKQ